MTTIHTHERFTFVANAPLKDVFPLFGADRERAWAPEWNPNFLWPSPAIDQPGMVFQTKRGDRLVTWVNTLFDPAARRVQYVYVLPEIVATLITIELHPMDAATRVVVTYERTALSVESNVLVAEMALEDRAAGTEWRNQIDRCLSKTSAV
jgi:hypothetical protein